MVSTATVVTFLIRLPNRDAWVDATKKERDPVAHGDKNMSSDVKLLGTIVKMTTAVV